MEKIMSIILMVLLAMSFSCQDEKSRDKTEKGFRLLSYNVWYGFVRAPERKSHWLQWMKEQAPDIVSLQELNEYTPAQLEEDALSWGHEYSVLLKEEGFPTGLTSRYPIEDVQITLEGFHHGLMRARIHGIYFYIIHLHPSKWQFRIREMDLILADIQMLPDDAAIILVGDFNTFSRHDAPYYAHGDLEPFFGTRDVRYNEKNLNNGALDFSVLDKLMDAGFVDLEFYGRGADYKFTGSFPTKIEKPGDHGSARRLDYVFATRNLVHQYSSAKIIADEQTSVLSDHLPVVAVFE